MFNVPVRESRCYDQASSPFTEKSSQASNVEEVYTLNLLTIMMKRASEHHEAPPLQTMQTYRVCHHIYIG